MAQNERVLREEADPTAVVGKSVAKVHSSERPSIGRDIRAAEIRFVLWSV